MAVPESKDELIKAINNNYSLLNKKLESIAPKLAFESLLEGHVKGTTISVANLVSYLIGWGDLVLHWHEQEAKGETIVFPEEGYKWNELGRLAQKFYRDYGDITEYGALLLRLKENKQQLVTLIEQFSNDELYGKPWYNQWTRGRMIQFNTASPYKNATGRINKLKKQLAI
ncbi:colibactin self-protection protein ClbS [Serratia nevei]|uniref:colibactin self-protection protein ClbS n=1 Tax=Serratia nevei TaxID=2703794 RepID=UPI0020A21D16|nr:colibactin self-protection protein ClbS [Serratia nevei]MCP1104258.1 colibactin self-protection protein ClbS [Serratia nevei]